MRAVVALERCGHDGMTQRELAEMLDIRSASVSELMAKMEESGLIMRTHDPSDKRALRIRLTERGHAEAKLMAARRAEANKNLFAVLDDEEKARLEVILGKLIRFWDEEFDREEHVERFVVPEGCEMPEGAAASAKPDDQPAAAGASDEPEDESAAGASDASDAPAPAPR